MEDFVYKPVGRTPRQQNHDNRRYFAQDMDLGSQSAEYSAQGFPTGEKNGPYEGQRFGNYANGPVTFHTEKNDPSVVGTHSSPGAPGHKFAAAVTDNYGHGEFCYCPTCTAKTAQAVDAETPEQAEARESAQPVMDDVEALEGSFNKFFNEEGKEGEHNPANLKNLKRELGTFLEKEDNQGPYRNSNHIAAQ